MEKEREIETRTVGAVTVWEEQRGGVGLKLMRFKKERLYRDVSGTEILAFSPLDEERFVLSLGEQRFWLGREELAWVKELVELFEGGGLGSNTRSGGGGQ